MQEAVLAAAAKAGAEVRRGGKVNSVTPGKEPSFSVEGDGRSHTVSARLVVGADGRNSMVRKWGGFDSSEEQGGNQLAGVMLENYSGLEDTATAVFNPFMGRIAFVFPQGGGKARAYFGSRTDKAERLQGDGDYRKLIEMSVQTGASSALYEGTTQAGPLATFPGFDS